MLGSSKIASCIVSIHGSGAFCSRFPTFLGLSRGWRSDDPVASGTPNWGSKVETEGCWFDCSSGHFSAGPGPGTGLPSELAKLQKEPLAALKLKERKIVDNKGLGKPEKFDGQAEKFLLWKIKVAPRQPGKHSTWPTRRFDLGWGVWAAHHLGECWSSFWKWSWWDHTMGSMTLKNCVECLVKQQNANLRHRHVACRRTEESLAECHSCSSVPSKVGAWDSQSNQETARGGRWDLFIRCGPGQYLTQSQMSQSSMRRKSDSIACLTVTSMSQALMYDSNTGAELDPKIFKAARMDELERMECRKIYVEVPIEEAQVAGKKVISLKWVDKNKGDAQRPNHRSRLVCREVKGVWEPPMRNTSRRFASFSAMPPLESRSKKGAPLLLKLLDISWAHLYGRADRDIYVELPEVTWANFWNVVIRDTWCGSDVGTELQHSVDQWRARKSTAFPTCFHIPTWWCSFFPGSPLPELIILKSPICTCYIHAPPRTQEIILVQFLNIIFLWCTNVRQKENNFHGGWVHSNIYDHLCTANPRKNDPWLFEGVRLFTTFGNGDIMIIMLNLHLGQTSGTNSAFLCQRAPKLQNMCFWLKIPLQKGINTYVQLHQHRNWLEEAEAQVSKI